MLFCAVSDDLSGGNDLAARVAPYFGPTWSAPVSQWPSRPAHAVVLSAETRFLSPAAAFRTSSSAWQQVLARWGAPLRFQKIDSTLRGQPAEDCAALLGACGARWMAVLPAYPQAGRVTRAGAHFVHGKRLDRTEYARDRLSPARSWRVDQLFPRAMSAHAPLRIVAQGSVKLAAWLRSRVASARVRFVTFDCVTPAHTRTIADACLKLDCRTFAGASDLAGALAARRGNASTKLPRLQRPWIFVIGSVSATSFGQLAEFARSGGHWVHSSDPMDLKKTRALLQQGSSVALSSLAARSKLPKRTSARQSERALDNLAHLALRLPARPQDVQWLVSGGHSAFALYAAAGWHGTWIHGELEPGLSLGQVEGLSQGPWVASKPGGFGRSDLFARLAQSVPRLERS